MSYNPVYQGKTKKTGTTGMSCWVLSNRVGYFTSVGDINELTSYVNLPIV